MKMAFSTEKLISRGLFLCLVVAFFLAGGEAVFGAESGKIYSLDLRARSVVSAVDIVLGDTIPTVVEHRLDSAAMMIFCHSGEQTFAYFVPYGGACHGVGQTNICLRGSNVFKLRNGFVGFSNNSQSGVYFSPTGRDNWYYIGRAGLDYSVVDCVAAADRNSCAVYYHHTFEGGREALATGAFIRAELDYGTKKIGRRRVNIKHNKLDFDRLEILRIIRRGYNLSLAFMQCGRGEIYISTSGGSTWSYPEPLIFGEGFNLLDVKAIRDKVHVLIERDGELELVRLLVRRGRCEIKDSQKIIKLTSGESCLKGCIVDRSRAMVVVR